MEKENEAESVKQDYSRKKVFISYSWSSKPWVNALANELVKSGIDVAVDFWDLREGGDMYSYSERWKGWIFKSACSILNVTFVFFTIITSIALASSAPLEAVKEY